MAREKKFTKYKKTRFCRILGQTGSKTKACEACNISFPTYSKYYKTQPRHDEITITINGIMGKANKSKRRKKEDKNTIKEYEHKIKLQVGEVQKFLHHK